MKGSAKSSSIVALLLLINCCAWTNAQSKHWRGIKAKPLSKFDWNCASPAALPKSSLGRLVDVALKDEDPATRYYADRAFAYDLNRDGKPEYFIPLDCGATGNCTFGLFTLRPRKALLGKVGGEYIYLYGRKSGWPTLITYAHMSAAEGILTTYAFRRGRYTKIGPFLSTDCRGGVYGKKVPAFLERARKGCKTVGN